MNLLTEDDIENGLAIEALQQVAEELIDELARQTERLRVLGAAVEAGERRVALTELINCFTGEFAN